MVQNVKTQSQSTYRFPQPLSTPPPSPIIATRDPLGTDKGFGLGQNWVNRQTGTCFELASLAGGTATWSVLGGGAADVNTISGDAGGNQTPAGGNIQIAGTAAQGITTSGAAHVITITASNAAEAQKGVVALATNAEAIAGADAAKAIVSTSLNER